MESSIRLNRGFFDRNTVDVACELLGKTLVVDGQAGIITETEAYRGMDDEASHAFKGPTKRSQIMFGPPGYVYVYLIYGMHHCFNIVTEHEGQGSAVLIRGLRINGQHYNGPGKLCKALNITREQNGIDLIESADFYLVEGEKPSAYTATPRIGIKRGLDKLWRFVAT